MTDVQFILYTANTFMMGRGNGLCSLINLTPSLVKGGFKLTRLGTSGGCEKSTGLFAQDNLRMDVRLLHLNTMPGTALVGVEILRDHRL